jgi:hypothetical protein
VDRSGTAPDALDDQGGDGGPDRGREDVTSGSTAPGDVRTDEVETLVALRRLSYYLDDLFVVPGTRYRVGLDPLLGLVPGLGDVATSTASAYIVAQAAALGVPRATLARMLVVLLVDAVVGSLPLVGDAFDAVWKANARNVGLLEARLDAPEEATTDRQYVLVVTVAVTLLLVLVGVGAVLAAWWLLGATGVV